jgi:hypothetical protein
MKLRTRREMRLYQRARRSKLRGVTPNVTVTPGVTGDVRRVIRTDRDTKWYPQDEPTEEKLMAKIKELEKVAHQAWKNTDKAREELQAYYASLGVIEPDPTMSCEHLSWIKRELQHRISEVQGYSKASKAERARLQEMRDRAEKMYRETTRRNSDPDEEY